MTRSGKMNLPQLELGKLLEEGGKPLYRGSCSIYRISVVGEVSDAEPIEDTIIQIKNVTAFVHANGFAEELVSSFLKMTGPWFFKLPN